MFRRAKSRVAALARGAGARLRAPRAASLHPDCGIRDAMTFDERLAAVRTGIAEHGLDLIARGNDVLWPTPGVAR
jgi:hypothetical protein